MEVIKIINGLGDNQYLEATNDPSNPLRCVEKPEFICLFTQALEFAKVLEIVQKNLKELPGGGVQQKLAEEKLKNRYAHFTQQHSSWALMLTSLFLWILGYRGENSLQYMDAKMWPDFTTETFKTDEEIKIDIPKYNSRLKEITLEKTVTTNGLKLIAEHCPQLESIRFTGLSSISAEEYQSFLQSCPTIRKICLIYVKEEDEIAKILLQNCPQLTELTLEGQITDDILECVAKNCPLLTSISFAGSDKITLKAAQNLIEKCPKLNRLDAFFCTNISYNGNKQLQQLLKQRNSSVTL